MSPTIPNGEGIPVVPEFTGQTETPDSRIPRTEETREQTARAPLQYLPPTLFPEPEPQDGFVFRWVCEQVGGVQHTSNISKRMQEGWRHVDASEQPAVCAQIGMVTKDARAKLRGSIRYLGMVLCKKPVEQDEARKRYYAEMTARQMDVVDNQNVALSRQPDVGTGIRMEHGGFRQAAEKDATVVYGKGV